ncbi:hypothetical protein [Paenarthrobacter nicotinovorans]|uniref:hypothetical protein n=1 Tax=Paenarthrobacter nicotinovorans TaxID=29320 RepID=UPI003D66CE72
MDQLVTLEKALERNRAEKTQKTRTPEPPKQRYRLSDRYSAETLAEIVSRYAAGEPSTQLANEYGIAKSSLLTLLAKNGTQSRSYRLTPAQEKQIRLLRSQGMALRTIAKTVGCGYGTVQALLSDRADQEPPSLEP